MSNDHYITFQKFSDPGEALNLLDLLKEQQIEGVFEDCSASFDPTFSNSGLNKEYRVKLLKSDFEPARQLLLKLHASQLENVDPGYYLFDFTDEELIEILNKQNEWSHFDFLLAQKILKDRGKDFDPDEIEKLWKKRITELAVPERKQTGWIIFGYICALAGGLLGIFIGWYLSTHKKTLPNGNIVYAYSQPDRKHGSLILMLGVVSIISWSLFKFFPTN